MKKAGLWRSLALISFALAGLAAVSFLWLRHNAGEAISPKMVLPGHADNVALQFFPDGKTLLSVDGNNSARLWDVDSGQLLQTKRFHSINGAFVSSDGKTIAVNGYTELRLWNVSTDEVKALKLAGAVFEVEDSAENRVQFSPDGRTIAAVARMGSRTSSEHLIYVWDVETGALLHTLDALDKSLGDSVSYSPYGNRLVTVGGNAAKVWDVKTGALLHTLHGVGTKYAIAVSPDGSQTAGTLASVCAGPSVKVWDLETGALLHTIHGAAYFKYSPYGIAIFSVRGGINTAEIWDVKTGALLQTFKIKDSSYREIIYSPDGKSVLSLDAIGGPGRVWDVKTGALLQTFRTNCGFWGMYSADRKKLIGIKTHADKLYLEEAMYGIGIPPLAWVEVWDAAEWEILQTSKLSPERIDRIAYSQDRKTLACSLDNGEIQIWDFEEAAPAP